jgi:nitronate monooxygenase
MFDLDDLSMPVVAAPMAGGVTTPELVRAAADTGALGMLATGYLNPERVRNDIQILHDTGSSTFGMNIFMPDTDPLDRSALAAYRGHLAPYADRLGVSLPDVDELTIDDDYFDAKVQLAIELSVPVVSFTFGCPNADLIARLHQADCSVGVTVTNPADALTAAVAGADWLCLQGPEAGGHRSTFSTTASPPTQPLTQLLREAQHCVSLPLIVAGGITNTDQAATLRSLGAKAVQVGTLLLCTDEAGTKPAHMRALHDPTYDTTTITRAFSGRPGVP